MWISCIFKSNENYVHNYARTKIICIIEEAIFDSLLLTEFFREEKELTTQNKIMNGNVVSQGTFQKLVSPCPSMLFTYVNVYGIKTVHAKRVKTYHKHLFSPSTKDYLNKGKITDINS